MSGHVPQLPEEAVEAMHAVLARATAGYAVCVGGEFITDHREFLRGLLAPAAPALRKQERERIRKALLSNEVIASLWADPDTLPGPADFGRQRRALEAFFDTLEDPDA